MMLSDRWVRMPSCLSTCLTVVVRTCLNSWLLLYQVDRLIAEKDKLQSSVEEAEKAKAGAEASVVAMKSQLKVGVGSVVFGFQIHASDRLYGDDTCGCDYDAAACVLTYFL